MDYNSISHWKCENWVWWEGWRRRDVWRHKGSGLDSLRFWYLRPIDCQVCESGTQTVRQDWIFRIENRKQHWCFRPGRSRAWEGEEDGSSVRNRTQAAKLRKWKWAKCTQMEIFVYTCYFILHKMSSALDLLEIFSSYHQIILIPVTSTWIFVLPTCFVLFSPKRIVLIIIFWEVNCFLSLELH